MTENELYAHVAAESAAERDAPRTILAAVAVLCSVRAHGSVTAPDVLAYAERAENAALRAALAHVAGGAPGEPVDLRKLGEGMRRRIKGRPVRLGEPGGLVRLVVDGKSGGRARWRVEAVPAYVPAAGLAGATAGG